MPSVTFKKNRLLTRDVVVDGLAGQTVLELAQEHGLPVGSNCGGVCGCSTCHVYVMEGLDALEEMSDREDDRLSRSAFDVRLNSRLSCQITVPEDTNLIIDITEESLQAFLDEHPAIRKNLEETGVFVPAPEPKH